MTNGYLQSVKMQFEYYKMLGEQAIAQVPEEKLCWQYNAETNSIATIVKHLCGNMLSRWTDFLTTDGEKACRNRDAEFENDLQSRPVIMLNWQQGWTCLFTAIGGLSVTDLDKEIYIRNMGHTVQEAINRQLAHYPYHIGQIVFIAKMVCGDQWISLSIPKGGSIEYNNAKFAQPNHSEHFTEEFLNPKKG